MKAMREAVEACLYYLEHVDNPMNGYMRRLFETAYKKAKAALIEPARNCDMGTAKQQEKRYMEECLRSLDCYKCKLDQGGCDCRFHWGQMPYEAGGTK